MAAILTALILKCYSPKHSTETGQNHSAKVTSEVADANVSPAKQSNHKKDNPLLTCLLYTSDAADE